MASSAESPGKEVIAIDCEMVWVSKDGKRRILARVSIVDNSGDLMYDKYVKPTEEVVDYRTKYSGIRPADIENGADFKEVQREVKKIISGKVLVGQSIQEDLKALRLGHPPLQIRDTALCPKFQAGFAGRNKDTPGLKWLSQHYLGAWGMKVQEGEHNSIEDAQAAMRLYTKFMIPWEEAIAVEKEANGKEPSTSGQTKKNTHQNRRSPPVRRFRGNGEHGEEEKPEKISVLLN